MRELARQTIVLTAALLFAAFAMGLGGPPKGSCCDGSCCIPQDGNLPDCCSIESPPQHNVDLPKQFTLSILVFAAAEAPAAYFMPLVGEYLRPAKDIVAADNSPPYARQARAPPC